MTSTRLSSRLSSRRRSDPGLRWVRVVMAVLATIGAIDTGAITLKRWGLIGPLSCPGGAEGCDKVLNSAWGSLFGQPLSLFGFLAYTTVLVLAVLPLILKGEARSAISERSWWGLFLLSGGMAVFSLLLMGLLVFKIKAFCFFCVLSAVLSLSLFVLSLIGGQWDDRGQLVFRGVLVALLVGLVGLGWAASVDRPAAMGTRGTSPPVISVSTPATMALAEHLSQTGAVMYSAYWCPHCHEQKELFGKEANAKLKVIECAADGVNNQKALCDSKNLEGFPTWEINGKLDSGVKTLAKLAELSGFKGQL
ncbi:thioredoxin [Synechococcus sp. Cruz-9H2]|uniref:vitamin K epoxide reductase family protein n=1 Tax=unclassified Synechococcus TaxID=2626047 RepID=UPI0020CC4F45|nr:MULTISPECIES: vitamin K epoxide reductase family protein [unclassified Synechococcus]MCP9820796.1 thioredoxin [Synechococcus sp. Cruz-9H2]MCP9845058.1 thioredoxin [Synechococcus sp. Edmonson 11F2]MCP9857152.1 thioredoxin [Synechococcus sp. Cruz-9C9]MCP9864464.1 thioredoxin [Synechococcus sp. Cruz-7E5]MCP9871706.1 thioredoxin [Synechococcus sp. Cruz-7B9]